MPPTLPRTAFNAGLCLLAASWLGCTQVTLKETQAFDVRKTVSNEFVRSLGYAKTEITMASEGLELSGWHLQKKNARGTILYFGGNGYVMSQAHPILRGLGQLPANLVTFDYRGYGENSGQPTVQGLKTDALSAYDFVVKDLHVDASQLVVHGQSLGSLIAPYVAKNRSVSGVVIETPVTNVDDLLAYLAPWWTRAFIRFDVDEKLRAEDNLHRVAQLSAPLLIIAGAEDRVAHPDMAKKLFQKAASEKKTLEVLSGGGHNDLPTRKDYLDAYRSFLDSIWPRSM